MNFDTKIISEPEVKITASGVSVKINQDAYVIQDLKFKSLFIISKAGYISIYAMRLLASQNISISLRDLNGNVVYDMIPKYIETDPELKIKQYQAFLNDRAKISKRIVQTKHTAYNSVFEKYNKPKLNTSMPEEQFSRKYWQFFKGQIQRYGYEYQDRKGKFGILNMRATGKINALLNFYYGLIEHRLLTQIAYKGLDYQISYLHEPQARKLSLSYDLVEPLRARIDETVLELAETKKIKETDFTIITDHFQLKQNVIPKYLRAIKPVEALIPSTVDALISWL